MMIKIKPVLLGALGAMLCVCGLRAEVTIGGSPIMVDLGTGSFVSYLVLDESSLRPSPLIYAWHYSGLLNAQGSAWTGTDLLNAVLAESAGTPYALSYTTGAYGLMTSFGVGSTASIPLDPLANPGSVWTYWIKGGSQDAYNDNGASFTISPTNWVVSPATADTRYLTNGSYDAWTVSPFSYTGAASDTILYTDINGSIQPLTSGTYTGDAPLSGVTPVPETSSTLAALLLLIILVASAGVRVRRRI